MTSVTNLSMKTSKTVKLLVVEIEICKPQKSHTRTFLSYISICFELHLNCRNTHEISERKKEIYVFALHLQTKIVNHLVYVINVCFKRKTLLLVS